MSEETLAISESSLRGRAGSGSAVQASSQGGRIEVSPAVVAAVAAEAVSECYGVVGMAACNLGEAVLSALGRPPATKGIRVRLEQDLVVVEVHVIVEYGTRVATVAGNVIDAVRFRLERSLGTTCLQINVYVEDVRVDLRNA
jgi:uncharacterized alkaline shock family protein YloU